MKKVLMLLLGAALVLSMAGAVAANEFSSVTDKPSAQVTYTVSESFTVVIPTSEIKATTTDQTLEIKVTKNIIDPTNYLWVTVSSANSFKLKHASTQTTNDYTLKATSANNGVQDAVTTNTDIETSNTVILKESSGSADAITTLSLVIVATELDRTDLHQGSYADTLSFGLSVGASAPVQA